MAKWQGGKSRFVDAATREGQRRFTHHVSRFMSYLYRKRMIIEKVILGGIVGWITEE
jgi:hypothetical protein